MKEEELRITIHIYKDEIIGIDAHQDSFESVVHLGGVYPSWAYTVPITQDMNLQIKLMKWEGIKWAKKREVVS